MVQQLLQRLLVGELSKYGRDGEGNLVISPSSLEEAVARVVAGVHRSIERPVVTINSTEMFHLASRAGFVVTPAQSNSPLPMTVMDKKGSVDFSGEVARLVDYTTQTVMDRVIATTRVKGE